MAEANDSAISLEKISERFRGDALSALGEYTSIPCLSPSFAPNWEADGHLLAAARLLEAWAKAQGVEGLTTEILTDEGRTPMLVVEVPGHSLDAPTALVYGHMDKQPPMGAWRAGLDPFRGVLDGDRFYGRGTGDDGYALFSSVIALRALDDARAPRPRTLICIEASEESGSPDLESYLERLAPRIGQPSLVVCLDSGALTYDRLWRTSSLRGNVVATITVSVLNEGIHSGSGGGIVPTSFRILRQLLSRIEDEETGEILLPALHGAIPEWALSDHRTIAAKMPDILEEAFVVLEGVELLGTSNAERLIARSWKPALAVTGIDGMPSPERAGNVLRPSTKAKISLRLAPDVDAQLAARAIEAALSANPPDGAHVDIEFEHPARGWVGEPLVEPLRAAFERASITAFGNPSGAFGEGGTIPFLALLGEWFPDAQILATGVLGPGSNAHGPNEFLHLPMAEAVTLALAELLAALGR